MPDMPAATKSSVAGWDEFIESLRTLPDRMLAKLPEEKRRDPQFQQEVGRLALEAVASTAIGTIGGDGDFPVFLPSLGQLIACWSCDGSQDHTLRGRFGGARKLPCLMAKARSKLGRGQVQPIHSWARA
jgi:hypothetical protein